VDDRLRRPPRLVGERRIAPRDLIDHLAQRANRFVSHFETLKSHFILLCRLSSKPAAVADLVPPSLRGGTRCATPAGR